MCWSTCRINEWVMSEGVVIQSLTFQIGYFIKTRFLGIYYGKIGSMDVITAFISWCPWAKYFRWTSVNIHIVETDKKQFYFNKTVLHMVTEAVFRTNLFSKIWIIDPYKNRLQSLLAKDDRLFLQLVTQPLNYVTFGIFRWCSKFQ